MLHDEFDRIFEETVEKSRSVLASKSKEYATEDKLHNFKVAAVTEGVSNRRALGGMMVKHTVSIYDLLRADECADLAMWDEKIGDHINYLILLRALVIEELGDEVFEAVADAFAEALKPKTDKIAMYPIIDNPRSGVKDAVISDTPVDITSKAHGVNLSYYCATCGQTSIKKYPNDGASIVDNSGMVCPVDNCGGWAEVTHWSVVCEDR